MAIFTEAAGAWLVLLIQAAGVLSVFAARISEHSAAPAVGRYLFWSGFLAVGAVTMTTAAWGSGLWVSGAATLGVMAIGATLDAPRGSLAHAGEWSQRR